MVRLLWVCLTLALGNAQTTKDEDITVRYVLEPFEPTILVSAAGTEVVEDDFGGTYLPDTLLFDVRSSGAQVTTQLDPEHVEGSGSLKIQITPDADDVSTDVQLQWTVFDEESAYNCLGADYLSFSYKVLETGAFPLFTKLSLLDDADCEERCALVQNNRQVPAGPDIPMLKTEDWTEVQIPLNSTDIHLDHIRGWTLDFVGVRNLGPTTLLLDHVQCVGGDSLVGASFYFNSYKGTDAFHEAVDRFVWREEYHKSDIIAENTKSTLMDGRFHVNYTIEHTEVWGGFFDYAFFTPANSYLNLSEASELLLDYDVTEPGSDPQRTHFRLVMSDGYGCRRNCTASNKNLEVYYNFYYILDSVTKDSTQAIPLEGNSDPASPLWLNGWSGTIYNGQFDKTYVKGWEVQYFMDSQGDLGSLVHGSMSIGNLRANSKPNTEAKEREAAVFESFFTVQEGMQLDITNNNAAYRRIEFQNPHNCFKLCYENSKCLYGVATGRDCFMASAVDPATTIYNYRWQPAFEVHTTFWAADASRRGDFCDVCDCQEATRTIDCSMGDLATIPKTFEQSWSPKTLDLRGNLRLRMIGDNAFEEIGKTLSTLYLPYNLTYLAPDALTGVNSDARIVSGDNLNNVILDSSQFYSDTCCSKGSTKFGMSFCEYEIDRPGQDAEYYEFIDLIESPIISALKPFSEFGSEASESVEKCAEFCSTYEDCRFFKYDQRYQEAEHTCFLLSGNGTAFYHCCDPLNDFTEVDGDIPGWVSGVAPRGRYEDGAQVVVSPNTLLLDAENDYTASFTVALGQQPMRGAVWITPTITSNTEIQATIMPERVALYDSNELVTVTVQIDDPSVLVGAGETLIMSNFIESCDRAFTSFGDEADNVYVQVVLPEDDSNRLVLILGFLVAFLAVLTVAVYVLWDKQRSERKMAELLGENERNEIEEVQKEMRMDNCLIAIGRSAIFFFLAVAAVALIVVTDLDTEAPLVDSVDETTRDVPQQELENEKHDAVIPTIIVAMVVLSGAFCFYDWLVRRRNRKLVVSAAKSSEIVASMFPEKIRDKLLMQTKTNMFAKGEKRRNSLGSDLDHEVLQELYPSTTICFMDICGFTAWSSSKHPRMVFQLLETIFSCFDGIAAETEVFTVETVGDCYVCIAGAPEHQEDHAVRVCHFAGLCLHRFAYLSRNLIKSLGPDTGDLGLRVGIHSGQVILGVLRSSKARYQLFGDSVNTTARIEASGQAGQIHVSPETAELLRQANRSTWLKPRTKQVQLKGKGVLTTYWLDKKAARFDRFDDDFSSYHSTHTLGTDKAEIDDYLVEWNTNQLLAILKKIIVYRQLKGNESGRSPSESYDIFAATKERTYLDDVAEIIVLPEYSGIDYDKIDMEKIEIDPAVVKEVRSLVDHISVLYNDNPFHNFEHASHVTLSILKLLSRIVRPSDKDMVTCGVSLYDFSYGITNDPLTHFAVAFCGLIHDADHPGVPNAQLVRENPELAEMYKGRSVAEQKSLMLAFNLLTNSDYQHLRSILFTSEDDKTRFRQLVVNTVMATDIIDGDLKKLRNKRWETAFDDTPIEEPTSTTVNRKATIVLEHLIQASDVSHTMQHWNVYRKWNERLLREMYIAYRDGRSETDPTINWAKGEIGFFDFYIIPLAKKLSECGVFGVSSAEYLNYAMINRRKWEVEGDAITAEMVERLKGMDPRMLKSSVDNQANEIPDVFGGLEAIPE